MPGYLSEHVPVDLLPAQPGRGALIARRGEEAWLVLYAYGDRRGLVEMGPLARAQAEFDALIDQPKDYFLARILVPFNGSLAPPVGEAAGLAEVLFPRLGAWYQNLHRSD